MILQGMILKQDHLGGVSSIVLEECSSHGPRRRRYFSSVQRNLAFFIQCCFRGMHNVNGTLRFTARFLKSSHEAKHCGAGSGSLQEGPKRTVSEVLRVKPFFFFFAGRMSAEESMK